MFRKLFTGLSLFLLLFVTFFSEVRAQGFPPLPHAFYGRVYINGEKAPAGTRIEGRGEAIDTGIQGNPIETVAEGFYGSTDNSVISLVVQGWVTEGTPIEFYVNGQKAYCSDGGDWEESYPYQAGGITALDLWLGPLETEEVLPTMTRTPTFAPTMPRTATSTAGPSSTDTATPTFAPTMPRTATSTAGPSSPDAATPTVTPAEQGALTGTPTPTRTAAAGLAVATTVQAETGGYQLTADSGNNLQVQEEPNSSNAGLVVWLVIGTLIILVAIWLVSRKKRKARSKGDEDLL